MNRKKVTALIICACLTLGATSNVVHAKDDSGKIDLYEVFSSKVDRLKTEVGSRVYKWSMHLPDDGIIYKSDKANYFNMSTSSYQSSIQLEVNKDEYNTTLEELLYKMQNRPKDYYYYMYGQDKEYVVDIVVDESGQKYIRMIKSNQFYDYYMVTEAAEELGDYIENRIYIANNYMYNLTVRMSGKFYRQHEEMFDKLVSSFKLSFDEKNPYIKELSDSVSSIREYKNSSYGWKLMLSPYWRVEGIPNARVQNFSPVYSDEELDTVKTAPKMGSEQPVVREGLSVNLVSSAEVGETASAWAVKELTTVRNNYNSEVYEVLSDKSSIQNGVKVHHIIIRYKMVTGNPYVIHNLYAIDNGYKYLVSATMKEEKYNDAVKRAEFEDMLDSFTLDKNNLSSYLGKLVSAASLLDVNGIKEFMMKKYDFGTKLTKNWNVSGTGYDFYYDKYFYEGYYPTYRNYISNNENINAMEPVSNLRVSMNAGLNTNEISELIKEKAKEFSKNDEIRMGLAKVKIRSTELLGAQVYYIEKEYDLNAIKKFVIEDPTKIYDLEMLQNQYEYIIKIGKDIYSVFITLPVANTSLQNKEKVKSIWENTSINKTSFGTLINVWKDHTLEDFK